MEELCNVTGTEFVLEGTDLADKEGVGIGGLELL